MPSVLAYHRPGSLDEASTLLAEPKRRVLAGGTVVVPRARVQRADGVELVDLQALGLDTVQADGARLTLGAMVRLGDLAGDEGVPALVREAARRELPSALRNQATVGGTVAQAERDSVLIAALLVHEAEVELHGRGRHPVADVLAAGVGSDLITAVSLAADGEGAIAATGRTPADTPIVAAVARRVDAGVRVALTGVADTPILVDAAQPTASVNPPSDFRGSAGYRLHLAATLTARVVEEVSS